jgi:phage terminase large subunit GpA-like protein
MPTSAATAETKKGAEEALFAHRALARGIRPAAKIRPSEWARENFVVPIGPMRGHKLDLGLTPYAAEIIDALAIDSPEKRVSVKKSAQTGISTIAVAWLFYLIDVAPDDMMYVLPTINAARDFNKDRLDEAIRGCKPVAAKVRSQRRRSVDASTTRTKKFSGGSLVLTGANSSADLATKSIRFAVDDEIDNWPSDVDGQGDPQALRRARQISFTRRGLQKELELSTPAKKAASRIDKAYATGDQRKWMMPCPQCGTPIAFEFEHLHFERTPPYNATYVAQCCGFPIDAWRQRGMVLSGKWVPTKPGPGRHRSYFINTLSSLLTSWDELARAYWQSRGTPADEQGFQNLWLGEPFVEEGHELDAAKIAAAAEDYPRNIVPPQCGRMALSADTQDDRLEWALWGFGPVATSTVVEQWLIAAGVINGDLETPEPWEQLDAIGLKKWPHAGGREYAADVCMIDSGGHHTQMVYRFCHRKSRWRAIKGNNRRDALAVGTPSRREVKDRFGRILFHVPLYLVNTHDLKTWLNHALKAIEAGEPKAGGLHLTREVADEAYVRQLAAERLVGHQRRDGFVDFKWEKISGQANEALDVAVYARAFAFAAYPIGLSVDRLTAQQWRAILAERHDLDPAQVDIFAPGALPEQKPAAAKMTAGDWAARFNG